MEFKNGYLGVAIVVMALFGSICIGFVGNLEGEEITQTVYRDATDVSSLYDYEPVNAYVEYSPNSNWTGWNDIAFDNNNGQNQFLWRAQSENVQKIDISMGASETWKYRQSGGETNAPYFNVRMSDGSVARLEATSGNPIKMATYGDVIQAYINNGVIPSSNGVAHDYTIDLSGRYAPILTYTDWQGHYMDGSTYGETVNDPGLGNNTVNRVYAVEYVQSTNSVHLLGINGKDIVAATTPDKLTFYWGGVYTWYIEKINPVLNINGTDWNMRDNVDFYTGTSTTENTRVRVTDNTDTYTVEARDGFRLWWSYVWSVCDDVGQSFSVTFDKDNSPIVIRQADLSTDHFTESTSSQIIGSGKRVTSMDWNQDTKTVTLHYYDGETWSQSDLNHYNTSAYIMWNGFVTKSTSNPAAVENFSVVWRDTMPAQYIDIDNGLFVPSNKTTINWSNGWNNGTVTLLVTDVSGSPFIVKAGDVTVTVSVENMFGGAYYYVDVNGEKTPVGLWRGIELTLNPMDSLVTWKSLKSIIGFRQYTVDNTTSNISADFGISYLTGFSVTNTAVGGNPRFGVVSTYVNMDDSHILMSNPTIDFRTLYPDKLQQGIRVMFSNAVKWGSSFTVGGNTYNIVDERVITDYGEFLLQDVAIYFNEGYGQISFDNRVAIPFKGEPIITFNGVWYFQTTMTTAKEITEHVNNLDVGHWNMDQTTFLIVFVAITLIGCAVGQLVYGFRILDIIFVGGGLLIIMAIMGM